MVEVKDVSPYVARELARLYPERWSYDERRSEFSLSTLSIGLDAPQDRATEAPMPRLTYKQVTFRRPFDLAGVDGRQPPGTYTIETVESLLETVSALVYRRTATLIHVTSAPGVKQGFPISPDDLERALARDAN